MKAVLLAAAALIATPLVAQTTPGPAPAGDPQTMTAPPAGQTTTPPPADPAPPPPPADPAAAQPMAPPPADPAPPAPPAASSDATATPAAAPTGKLPWCRAGQYTGCREHSNAKGEGLRKR